MKDLDATLANQLITLQHGCPFSISIFTSPTVGGSLQYLTPRAESRLRLIRRGYV